MKIRNGFVSNSSSSSFVCDVCGEMFEKYSDVYYEDICMCKTGHEFCAQHLKHGKNYKELFLKTLSVKNMLNPIYEAIEYENIVFPLLFEIDSDFNKRKKTEKKKLLEKAIQQTTNENMKEIYISMVESCYPESDIEDIPVEDCPVCNLNHISDEIILEYILKSNKISKKEIVEQIKSKFKNLEDLKKWNGK
jgi:hypothetical protein